MSDEYICDWVCTDEPHLDWRWTQVEWQMPRWIQAVTVDTDATLAYLATSDEGKVWQTQTEPAEVSGKATLQLPAPAYCRFLRLYMRSIDDKPWTVRDFRLVTGGGMATITVDISEQMSDLIAAVESACSVVLNTPDSQRAATVARFAHGTLIERMVAGEYYKITTVQESAMKVKIISNGDARTSQIVDAETGQEIEGVSRVEVYIDPSAGFTRASLYIEQPQIEVVAQARVIKRIYYDPHDTDSINNAIAQLQAERAERMRQ